MAWPYNYRADGTQLATYAKVVRIPNEGRGPKRGDDKTIPWRHGVRRTTGKFFDEWEFPLECDLRYTNGSGAITHANGKAGHAYENYRALKNLLTDGGGDGVVTLARNEPDAGEVEIDIEVADAIRTGDPWFRAQFLCRAAFPFWRSASIYTATKTAIATSSDTLAVVIAGDVPLFNPVITITADTQPVTNARVQVPTGAGGPHADKYVQLAATIAAGDSRIIDIGARTVVDGAGDNKDAELSVAYADWMPLPVGSYSLAITCDTGSLDFDVQVTGYFLYQ